MPLAPGVGQDADHDRKSEIVAGWDYLWVECRWSVSTCVCVCGAERLTETKPNQYITFLHVLPLDSPQITKLKFAMDFETRKKG